MSELMRRFALAALSLGLMNLSEGRVVAGLIVDATVSGGGNSTLGTLDLTTGQFNAISTLSTTVEGLTSGSNGTLYATDNTGSLYTIAGGVATQFGSLSGNPYFGLAAVGSGGFFGANTGTGNIDSIAPDGNSSTAVGTLLASGGSGMLAFGPGGTLYYVGFPGFGGIGPMHLFSFDTTTGASTEIGSGLGTASNDALTLVYAGGQLYGIDTYQAAGSGPIDIYTINTTTGVADFTGVTVSGLAGGFTLDTAAALSVPEPSSFALCAVAGAIGLAVARVHRKRGE